MPFQDSCRIVRASIIMVVVLAGLWSNGRRCWFIIISVIPVVSGIKGIIVSIESPAPSYLVIVSHSRRTCRIGTNGRVQVERAFSSIAIAFVVAVVVAVVVSIAIAITSIVDQPRNNMPVATALLGRRLGNPVIMLDAFTKAWIDVVPKTPPARQGVTIAVP